MESSRELPPSSSLSPRPVRVALDARALQGEDAHRGIGRYTRGLTESLLSIAKESKLEIHLVLVKGYPAPDLNASGASGVLAVDAPVPASPVRRVLDGLSARVGRGSPSPKDARALVDAARRCGADVLHVASPLHGPFGWAPVPRPRCVATVYDLIPVLHPARFLESWPEAARARYLRRLGMLPSLEMVFAISRSVAEDLVRHTGMDPTRIRVAYPGVHFSAGREPEGNERAEGGREGFLLAFVSRNPSKNAEGLLRGFALLPPEMRRARRLHLLESGDTETRQWLGDLARRLGISEEVDFLGEVTDAELAGLYRKTSLVLLPSTAEGFGLPALEAMALGAPVAVSRLPVLDEVLGDAAFYFDPRDPASLASAVRAALDSPELLAAASRKGRERAALFSWEKTARLVADAYREVAMRAG